MKTLQDILDKLEEIDVDPSSVQLRVVQADNGWAYSVTDIVWDRPPFTNEVLMTLEVEEA